MKLNKILRLIKMHDGKNTNRTRQFLLMIVLFNILLLLMSSQTSFSVFAQTEEISITEVGDRYSILNWTIPNSLTYNAFKIDLENIVLNQSSTWSMVLLNETQDTQLEYFTQVNYTKDNEVFYSLKYQTLNFTTYIVSNESTTIQSKVTGLIPTTNYTIALYLANISLIPYEGNTIIKINSEVLFWESESFLTLAEIGSDLGYSKLATSLSLAVIVLIFIILFFFVAKRDVPFNRIAYVFIFPALLALVLLEVYPILYGIFLSFTDYNLERGQTPIFNGLDNYAIIADNPQLPITLTTTLVWSVLIIVAKVVLGFVLAYIIQYKVKRKKLWYLILYIPWAIPSYIKILSWRTFIHGSGGGVSLFNTLFGTEINMLNQPYVALVMACFVEVWDSIPLITTLFLGGLSSIPKELNDIVEIDQIPERTRIRRVIIPLIKPIILPAIILEIIKTFGSFNVAFLLTKGHPLLDIGTSEAGVIGATDLFSTFTFYMFYERREIGIAAAYSTIMSLLTLFFVLIWLKMSRGTQSTFTPEKKRTFTGRISLSSLFLLQAVGYILAGILNFRYFGIFWNPYLNYIFAGIYSILSIIFFMFHNRVLKPVKCILLIELVLSLCQFFFYDMWTAFNWNLFIVVGAIYVLSNIQPSSNPIKFPELVKKLQEVINKQRLKIKNLFYLIDKRFQILSTLHAIMFLQVVFLILTVFTKLQNVWSIWLIVCTFIIIILTSLFSKSVLKFAIVLQFLLWDVIIISKVSVGWTVIFFILSVAYFLSSIELYQEGKMMRKNKIRTILRYLSRPRNTTLFLFTILLITSIPLWNILWIAFSKGDTIVPTSFFPENFTFENFGLLFSQEELHLNFLNSLIISLGSATLCVTLTALAAYAFSRYSFTGKKEIMVGVFVLKMFTGILTLIPFFLIMFNLGLIDSYVGVILAYSTHTIPLALWVIKGYIDSIPKELDESATLMGNSRFRVLRKIIIPLAGPALAITFLLNFLRTWNGFLLSFVLLQTPEKYTLPIRLFTFVGSIESSSPEWGLFAAASIIVILPLLIIFVFLRNYLLSGFNSSTTI
ncbi:ABC transporter permease subunit, partial [Candidatus Heimdallarchaeota archaeon]